MATLLWTFIDDTCPLFLTFPGLPPSPNPSTGQDGGRLRAHARHAIRKSLGAPGGGSPANAAGAADSVSLCSAGGVGLAGDLAGIAGTRGTPSGLSTHTFDWTTLLWQMKLKIEQ